MSISWRCCKRRKLTSACAIAQVSSIHNNKKRPSNDFGSRSNQSGERDASRVTMMALYLEETHKAQEVIAKSLIGR